MTYTNIRSKDRYISLSPIPGKDALSSTGLVDNRLFSGQQKLVLRMDPQTCLWYFQYSQNGLLPEGLKGRFTGFRAGLKYAEDYFKKRNIQIIKVDD